MEEVSVSCRGVERVQLLRRWLVALKEIERLYGGGIDHGGNKKDAEGSVSKDSPKNPTVVSKFSARCLFVIAIPTSL